MSAAFGVISAMQRTKTNFTEEAFLLSTFREFMKCWKSSKRSQLSTESSVNGEAFVNFSVFLGNPSETHFNPDAWRQNPSPKEGEVFEIWDKGYKVKKKKLFFFFSKPL